MFREDKTTQMAARLLMLAGGRMPSKTLMLMLYAADREMLVRRGKPISYDRWLMTERGPVLGATLDLIRLEADQPSYWSNHILMEGDELVLKADPGNDDSSRAEDAVVDQVFREWGGIDQWDEAELIRRFPECNNSGAAPQTISYQKVLQINGYSQEEATDVVENIEMQDDVYRLLSTVR